jgi:hypothetical protein
MLYRQRNGDRRSPRMPKDYSSLNIQPIECLLEQICLCFRGPNDIPGPQAMSESWAVEHDHSVVLGRKINQAARLEILDHAAVAVKEYQRPAIASFHEVQTNPFNVDEPPLRGIVALGFLCKPPVYDRRRCQDAGCRSDSSCYRILPENSQTV